MVGHGRAVVHEADHSRGARTSLMRRYVASPQELKNITTMKPANNNYVSIQLLIDVNDQHTAKSMIMM